MANRNFSQFRLSLEKQVTDIFAQITFGSTGAPTLVTAQSKGVVSVSRTSAGLYVLTFGTSASRLDTYNKLLMAQHRFILASGAPAAPLMHIKTDSTNVAAATLTIQFLAADGTTATDPASGEKVDLAMTFRNSSAV